ncbi:MAG: hypothetical protein ACF788_02230 [Novipirellula sp. JB048]
MEASSATRSIESMIKQITAPHHRLLVLLLLADVVFIVLYGLYGFKFVSDPKFGLIEDWSYGEVYQYIKELWIIALLPFVAVQQRTWRYGVWMLVFTLVLLDDSCQIHERIGDELSLWFNLPSFAGLRPQDFGEMLYAAVLGFSLLSLIAASFWNASVLYRRTALQLIGLLAALAFFGVGVDMIRLEAYPLLDKMIGAIEDGGEHLVISVITWFVYLRSLPDATAAEA